MVEWTTIVYYNMGPFNHKRKVIMKTIKEAKEYLHENFQAGAKCPVCRQRVHLSPLKLDSTMAAMLCRLSWKREPWTHVKDLILTPTTGRNFASLKHWGLIAERENDDDKKRNSGYWLITDKGRNFVKAKAYVPRHALLYNRRCWGFSKETTGIRTALGDKFDFQELRIKWDPDYTNPNPPF